MSRVLWFHGIGGASGDMILGALLQLGVEAREVEEALRRLGIGALRIEPVPATDRGIRGIRLRIGVEQEATSFPPHKKHDAHPHRTFREIRDMVERSPLPTPVKGLSLDALRLLAEAEGQVHGIAPEAVQFHEIGAVDSIADIVGACFARYRLSVEHVCVEPLPIGRGTVTCAHGEYPAPAPATVELLRGAVIAPIAEPWETVTPTGAALLRSWADLERPPARCRIVAAGYGLGVRELLGRPNALRATLLEMVEADADSDGCLLLECAVDDQTPELVGVLAGRLMEEGALDVFTVAAQMKKQRPGVLLTVLCRPEQRDALLDLLFREGTTFGVRERWTERHVLSRSVDRVATPYGDVRVKIGKWRGRVVTRAPEMDDCVRLAAERGISARAVYEAAFVAAHRVP